MSKRKTAVQVKVKVPSDHTMTIPKGTEELVAQLFGAAGLQGKFTLHLGKLGTGSSHTKGISVRPRNDQRVIMLRVQPGDNATNRMLKYMVPDGTDPEVFFHCLKSAEEKMEVGDKLVRWERKIRKLYRLVKGESFTLENISQVVLDEIDWSIETLGEALESLARHHRFIKISAKKPGCFEWLDGYRAKMADSGYNADSDDRPSASPFPEEEREEDQLVNRLLVIEEETTRIDVKEAALKREQDDVTKKLSDLQAAINDLLKQAEQQNSLLEKIRKEEESLLKKEAALKHQRAALEADERKVNDKLTELEAQRKIEQACATADPALDNLSLAEQGRVLEQLLKNRPELAGLAAEILQKRQPVADPPTPAE